MLRTSRESIRRQASRHAFPRPALGAIAIVGLSWTVVGSAGTRPLGLLLVAFALLLGLLRASDLRLAAAERRLAPAIALYVLAVSAPWEEVLYVRVAGQRVKLYEVAVLILAIAIVVFRWRLTLDTITVVAVLFVASGFLGMFPSPLPRDAITVMGFQLTMLALFTVVRSVQPRIASARELTLVYVLVAGNVVALFALAQFAGYYLGAKVPYFHPEAYSVFRPYATFIEPNTLGAFSAGQFVLAFVLASASSFSRWRWQLILSAALEALVLALTLSRGPWLAAVFALTVYGVALLVSKPQWRRRGLIALAVLGLALPGLFYVRQATSSFGTRIFGGEGTATWRVRDTRLALDYWRERPLTGYGPGIWAYVAHDVQGRDARTPPRNSFAAWLFERGLVGAALGLLFYGLVIRRVARMLRPRSGTTASALLLAHGLSLLAIFITFVFASAEIVPYYWFQLGLLLAVSDGVRRGDVKTQPAATNTSLPSGAAMEPDLAAAQRTAAIRVLYLSPTGDLYGANQCLLDPLDRIGRHIVEPYWVLPAPGPLADALGRRGLPRLIMPELAVLRRAELRPDRLLRLFVRLVISSIRLWRIIRRERIEIVHSNSAVVLSGAYAALVAGVPHVWHVREVVNGNRRLWGVLGRQILARSSRVLCMSQAAANQFDRFKPKAKPQVIYNGVNWGRTASDLTRFQARRRWDLPPRAVVIASLGYLNPRKGVDLLIEAYAAVSDATSRPMRLILAGEPFAGNESFAAGLQQRSHQLGLDGEVLFPGFVADIATLLAAIDIFALPTREPEGFGLAVLEATAAGRPVLGTAIGGVLEIVEHGSTGILVAPNSTVELISALTILVGDTGLRLRMGQAGQEVARQRFGLERTVSELIDVYRAIAEHRQL